MISSPQFFNMHQKYGSGCGTAVKNKCSGYKAYRRPRGAEVWSSVMIYSCDENK